MTSTVLFVSVTLNFVTWPSGDFVTLPASTRPPMRKRRSGGIFFSAIWVGE